MLMSNFKFVNIDMSIVHAYSPLPCFLLYIIMRSSTRYKIEQVSALSLTDWVCWLDMFMSNWYLDLIRQSQVMT